ncbi:hypothetical protein E4U45_008520 [Claviceps purpurea]|nr:hypothetical protein E4U45_008520 [Claviceps purpurea]
MLMRRASGRSQRLSNECMLFLALDNCSASLRPVSNDNSIDKMINQSLFNFAEKPQPLDTSLQPKGVAEAALLYDDILDNYKLEKCKNIADYAELSRARNSIYSFDSRWDLPDSTFWVHNNLASTKNKDGSETDGFTFREVSQDDKNEVHALSAHSGRPFCDHCKKPGYRISQLNMLHQAKRNESKTKQTSGPSEPTTQQPLPDTSNQGLISWAPPTDIRIWCGLWYWFQLEDAAFTRSQTSSTFPAYAIKDGWLAPWHARMAGQHVFRYEATA